MKKFISFNLIFVLLLLCGCSDNKENKETRMMLDTVVTLTASCSEDAFAEAFTICESYENLFSKTRKGSDIYRLNKATDFIEVSEETAGIITDSLLYSKISGDKFDITVAPVVSLWDFENSKMPSRDEISSALENVDYNKIQIQGTNNIFLNGAQVDLGAMAKGYIADQLLKHFKLKNASKGIIDLGRNIVVFGDRDYDVGIVDPFESDKTAAVVTVRNKSVVTSGTYERSFKKNGKLYHHIIDPETGYPAETDLASATIIGDSCVQADALSTICILVGKEKAKEIVQSFPGVNAVFIDTKGNVSYTDGLAEIDGKIVIK